MAYSHSVDLPRSAAAWSIGQPAVNGRDGKREGMKEKVGGQTTIRS